MLAVGVDPFINCAKAQRPEVCSVGGVVQNRSSCLQLRNHDGIAFVTGPHTVNCDNTVI